MEIIGPAEGELAEGEVGAGRMVEPDEIAARIAELARLACDGADRRSQGRRVVISAGGTREPLDTVRFLGNRSSGRMGVALAEEARSRGADVTLLAANLAVSAPAGVTVDRDADRCGPRARSARPSGCGRHRHGRRGRRLPATHRRSAEKRPKDRAPWTVELEPTPDVLAALGAAPSDRPGSRRLRRRRGRRAGSSERARSGRIKNADLFVFNDVSRADIGFDALENEVIVLSESGERHVDKAPKREVAAAVLDEVERLLSN